MGRSSTASSCSLVAGPRSRTATSSRSAWSGWCSARAEAALVALAIALPWIAATLPARAASGAAPAPLLVAVHVTADRGVPDTARLEVEHELTVELTTTDRCALRVADASDAGNAAATLVVHLGLWREGETPGGEAVFDPAIGNYRPGILRRVEVEYAAQLFRPGEPASFAEDHWRRNATSASRDVLSYDPHVEARRRALRYVNEDVGRFTCKQLKKLRPAAR